MLKIINCLFLIVFCTAPVFAASILQSKNGRILISLDGDKASVGQTITLLDTDGKAVATAVIAQAKGGKAIANIKTGKADGSETVQFAKAAAKEEDEAVAEDSYSKQSKGIYRLNSTKVSMLLAIGMNSMNTKQTDGNTPVANIEDVAMKGMSIGVTGAMDYPLNNWLILRGTLGFEPFNASGTATNLACDERSSTNCSAMINYLAGGGFARFNFTKTKLQMWGGLGATTKFPISKSTTALRNDDIKMTMTFAGALGLDYFLSNKTFLPASLEYQLFQASDTVTANIIMIRAGYGWAF